MANFYIEPNILEIKSGGCTNEIIELRADRATIGEGWEITTIYDLWCDITIEDRYSSSTNLIVNAPENPYSTLRDLVLQVKYDGEEVGKIEIIQDAKEVLDYEYSINPISLTYTNAGGSKEVTLYTDSPYGWSVVSKPLWVTTSINGFKLTATASANDSNSERIGDIDVKCGDEYTGTISVRQEPLGDKIYNVTPTEIVVDGTGGTHTIKCTSNSSTTWRIINRPDPFIHYNWSEMTGDDVTLVLTFNENIYDRQQFGSIIIVADDGAYEVEISVNQKAKNDVNVTPTSFDVDNKAQSMYATAYTNYDTTWSISTDNDWITASVNESDYGKYIWYFKISVTAYDGDEPRIGSVSVTDASGVTETITIIQNGNEPKFSNEYWSIPPMFMDGVDSINYYNLMGESSSADDIKINRNSGINNHALTSIPYYDSDIRLYFADDENKPVDGSDVLVFYNNRKYFADDFRERYLVNLTDDVPEMLEFNDGESCWIYSLTDTNVAGDKIAIQVLDYPQFSRYIANGYNVSKNFDLGNPVEEYSMNYNLKEDTDIYGQFWKKYLTDQYSRNTRILECYVRIPYGLMQDYLRNFFYFDNSYWILIEVVDYNLTREQSCKCKFIKVNDTSNYTNGQII